MFYKHPWVFSGAIAKVEGEVEKGAVADLFSADGKFLAKGYYNPDSNIAIRILSFESDAKIDLDFFVEKITAAWKNRQRFLSPKSGMETNVCRVVFAESDGLPGLIVDKYDSILVLQIHTLGMDKLRNVIVEALVKVFDPKLIYERSDVSVRRQDGLSTMPCGVLYGDMKGIGDGKVEVVENGIKFKVDIVNGQKTGFFIDQRENRLSVRIKVWMDKIAKNDVGAKVLNLFSYSGGFSVNAALGGASKVVSVDISKEAIELCKKNFELNKFKVDEHEFVCEDVFAYLDRTAAAIQSGKMEKFDVVIVDPPAFVKSKKDVDTALKAYSRLNTAALAVLKENGFLISSSCSGYVKPDDFKQALFQASLKAKCGLQILESRTQPFDHPISIFFPEGEYLKFFVCQKV